MILGGENKLSRPFNNAIYGGFNDIKQTFLVMNIDFRFYNDIIFLLHAKVGA